MESARTPGESPERRRWSVGRRRRSVLGRGLAPLGGVAAAVLVGFLALARDDPMDPHGRPGRCVACHAGPAPVRSMRAAAESSGTAKGSYPLRAPNETASCGLCHPVSGEQIHPVDVTPSFRVPSGFPLDAGGRLVCSSCHDPHRARRVSARGEDPLLRADATGETLCRMCHDEFGGGNSRAWHIVMAEPAHGAETEEDFGHWGEIDRLSGNCLGCHDGSITRNVDHAGTQGSSRVNSGDSHPIGMNYRASASARGPDRARSNLRDVSLLDDRIRLFGGKVGCGSCHNSYSGNPYFLVMEGGGGTLCLSCHEM